MTERCRYCGTLDDDEDWHTPTRCREDMRAKIEAYRRCEDAALIAGREDERAAIVAWLRAKPPVSVLAAFLAAEIERGEHAGVKA